ncbi:MAG: methyltransferase domain-containing protein [Pseudoxanthomonas sp.]
MPHRGLFLHSWGDRYAGSMQCGLPLPLPNESIGNIILQHTLDDDREGLLEECARVLEPGGRLWLFALNPWSPYRARWRSSGLRARDAQGWRHRLRLLGLQPCGAEVSYLGPLWRATAGSPSQAAGRLRAVCLLEVEKRTASLIPPAPVARQWQAGTAPA